MLGNNIRVIFSNKNYRFKTSSDLFHVLLLNLFSVLSTSVCWVSSCTHTFPRPFRWRASPSSGDPGHQWASPLPRPTASPTFPSLPCAGSLSSALHQLQNCHTDLPQSSFCSVPWCIIFVLRPTSSWKLCPDGPPPTCFQFIPTFPSKGSCRFIQHSPSSCWRLLFRNALSLLIFVHLNIQFSSFLSYMYSFFQLGFGICKSGSQVF